MDILQIFIKIISFIFKFKIDFNSVFPAIMGLVGVFIGSIISYYFNKKLSNSSRKAQIAIQRKNLIYSKLYKELINIKQSLGKLPKNCFYFELATNISDCNIAKHFYETFYFDGENYEKTQFVLWGEMKNDIRKNYISSEIMRSMENLEVKLDDYLKRLTEFEKKCEDEEKENNKKMIEVYQKKERYRDSIFSLKFEKVFYSPFSLEEVVNVNIKDYNFETDQEIIAEIRNVLKIVIDTVLLEELKNSFYEMERALNNAFNILNNKIQDIINNYEYGELL